MPFWCVPEVATVTRNCSRCPSIVLCLLSEEAEPCAGFPRPLGGNAGCGSNRERGNFIGLRSEVTRTAYVLSYGVRLPRPRIQGGWALDKYELVTQTQRERVVGGTIQRAQPSPRDADEISKAFQRHELLFMSSKRASYKQIKEENRAYSISTETLPCGE